MSMSIKTGTDNKNKVINSQQLDDTGLMYFKARYYDPSVGRFITADTIIPDPGKSQSFNRYMFVAGSPVQLMDADGHEETNSTGNNGSDTGSSNTSSGSTGGSVISSGCALISGAMSKGGNFLGGAASLVSSGISWAGANLMSKASVLGDKICGNGTSEKTKQLQETATMKKIDFMRNETNVFGKTFQSFSDIDQSALNRMYLKEEKKLVGGKYVWGGNDPEINGGTDCSGSVLWALKKMGIKVDDMSADDIRNKLTKPTVNAEAGNLLFNDWDYDGEKDHVTTYDGENRINPHGGSANTINNPGSIIISPGIGSGAEVRSIDWNNILKLY